MNDLIIHESMPNGVYHSKKDYISSSFVKQTLKHSVAKALEPLEPSDALVFGDQFHTYIEDVSEYKKRFKLLDDSDIVEEILTTPKRDGTFYKNAQMTGKYKSWLEEQKALLSKSQSFISLDRHNSIVSMASSIHENEVLKDLMQGTEGYHPEWSFFTKQEDDYGLKYRFRPDLHTTIAEQVTGIYDWKTCGDSSFYAFKADFYKYAYDVQAVFTAWGLGVDPSLFKFVAVEKNYPYNCAVYGLSEDTIERAFEKMFASLEKIADYKKTGYTGLAESKTLNLI